MQHGSARPLAVKYITDHGRRHSDQGEPSSARVEAHAGLGGGAGGAERHAERARQRRGLVDIDRLIARHLLEQSAWSGRALPMASFSK